MILSSLIPFSGHFLRLECSFSLSIFFRYSEAYLLVSNVTDSSNSSVKKSLKKYNSLATGMIKLNPGSAVNLGRGYNFVSPFFQNFISQLSGESVACFFLFFGCWFTIFLHQLMKSNHHLLIFHHLLKRSPQMLYHFLFHH